MDSDKWSGRWAVEGEGGGGDEGTFDAIKNVKNVRFLTSILGYQKLEIDKSENSISKLDY